MYSAQRAKDLEQLEKKLGLTFLNKALLNQALTHSSYAHEHRKKGELDNERLEFLGDAVLKLVTSEYLYNKYPEHAEGGLTKIRAAGVSDEILSRVALKLKLGDYLHLGTNERRTGGKDRKSNIANALEALIAAVYLDAGLGKARDMVLQLLEPELDKLGQEGFISDYKSTFQELVQKLGWGLPHYEVTKETGPRHDRLFWIEVTARGKLMGRGKGKSKKEAEQAAAREAYDRHTKKPGWRRFVGAASRPLKALPIWRGRNEG